ncbi:carboxypeptidase regulatory-like domain-containing protein [Polyangium aurulentum]|uniref:carboxypeptidase regulatory-like domain-containing protein n=1 Tax=Polyangium aurulentum TaxID=2567896 RepID=UPI0010AEA0A0|nr:carboxypeptidase regulatory-like domain-containing protein [Polyangium aurulentum]UQA57716.1 carboxypeptidase regulatory-like domain-containing protein [Polyangium aurulentum]
MMTGPGKTRAWLFVVLGLVVAAVAGWALWARSGKTTAGGAQPPASASSPRGAERSRGRTARLPENGSITGRVTDPAGAPVAGATVCATAGSNMMPFDQAEPKCTPAAQDGQYRIADLVPGRFTLFASAPGYRPGSYASPDPERARFVDLRAGEARTGVDFKLPRGGVEVKGLVKDVGGGAIAGALVTLHGWMGPSQGAVVTRSDAEGAFSAWLDEGQFIARASAEGYADGWKDGAAPGPAVEILLTPGSALVGRVVESGTGEPVAGAKIDPGLEQSMGLSSSKAVMSDEEGHFRVEGLSPGRYKPSARAPGGFGQARESVLLGVGEVSGEVVIEMHAAHSIAGRVVVAPGGEPCKTGSVALVSPTGAGMLQAALDADGWARFEGLLPGSSYDVFVHCPDHAMEPKYPPVKVGDADIEDLVWSVRAGLSLRGRVVDREDKPVRASIHAAPVEAVMAGGGFTQNDDDGRFVLRGLLPGKYRLGANAEGHIPPEPLEVEVDERAPEVTITVDSGGTIEGTVTDEDRRPIAGAEIMITPMGPSAGPMVGRWGPPARSRADGAFVQKGVAPGDYRVWAMQGGAPLRAAGGSGEGGEGAFGVPVSVKAGTPARVAIVVERQGGEIHGRVVDESGKPVTDAFIDATREAEGAGMRGAAPTPPWGGGYNSTVLTDTEGEFVVGNLGRGTYTVHAYRKGGGSAFVEHAKVGDTVTLTIQRTAAIAGTVSVPGGAPPDQFTIRLVNQGAAFFRSESFVFTNGAFSISDVPEGKYQISAEAPQGTASVELTLAKGERRSDVAIALAARTSVRGQVVSLEDGAPMAGVNVMAHSRTGMGAGMHRQVVTDGAGQFELQEVPSGPIMVMCMPADPMGTGYDVAAIPIAVQAGAPLDLGRIPMPKRRMKPGDVPGDLGFSLKEPSPWADLAVRSFEVTAVRPEGPAAAADLRVGDVIVSVDGHDVTGKMSYLYGSLTNLPEGTKVTLGVARGAAVTLVAAKAALPSMPPGMAPPAEPAPPPPDP